MTGSRSFGGAADLEPTVFRADQPVSALKTLYLANNVQHLVDASCGYLINWVASTSSSELGAGGEIVGAAFQYDFAFPLTISDWTTLPSFDLRVGVRLTGTLTDALVTAKIHPLGSNSSIFLKSWTISSAGAAWHDAHKDVNRPYRDCVRSIPYRDPVDGSRVNTHDAFCMAQLSIVCRPDDPLDGSVQLVGVHLREYLSR